MGVVFVGFLVLLYLFICWLGDVILYVCVNIFRQALSSAFMYTPKHDLQLLEHFGKVVM